MSPIEHLVGIGENVERTFFRIAQQLFNSEPVLVTKVLRFVDNDRVVFLRQNLVGERKREGHLDVESICVWIRCRCFGEQLSPVFSANLRRAAFTQLVKAQHLNVGGRGHRAFERVRKQAVIAEEKHFLVFRGKGPRLFRREERLPRTRTTQYDGTPSASQDSQNARLLLG